jgi:4a-hydroxytetrahydrobiopterin dehydratase
MNIPEPTTLEERACRPCEGGIDPLTPERVARLLPQVPGWALAPDGATLTRHFEFGDFGRTIAFLNALAWLANRQGHHPDFTVAAYHCTVNFTTHAIGGLSENDFICAARVNRIVAPATETAPG